MGKKDDDDVSEEGYDPGDEGSDDEAERFILDTHRDTENDDD
jgi:hypothetical protein